MLACRLALCRRWGAPCLVVLVLAGPLDPLFPIDFPTIDSPSMPSLSSPSSGPSTPWRGGAPYIPSPVNSTQQAAAAETDSKDTAAGLALTAQSISGLGGLEALESLRGGLGGLGGLEGLSGLGGLNGVDALKSLEALKNLENEEDLKEYLSALSGSSGVDTAALEEALKALQDRAESTDSTGTAKAAADAPPGSASDEGTAATLQQILRQLEILAQQAGGDKAVQETAPQKRESGSDPSERQGPENLSPSRILRFRANAADILATCTTVYFSQPDPAGAFLLTGDRMVHGGGKERNETFYFLFTPTLNQEGSFIYQVEAQLMQDWPTERSELYPLTANLSLTATRTGNLVALRHTSADWTLDLLLDLREVHGDGE